MRNTFLVVVMLLHSTVVLCAQPTFKAGWKTYTTAMVVHEFNYSYTQTDSTRLYLTDSVITYVATDSLVTMTESFSNRDRAVYKTISFFSPKKQLLKTENYKDDNLLEVNEWRYDDKNRKIQHYKDDKMKNISYRKQYGYATDKKTGETVITESSYFNNKIEFYTKCYYDKRNVKYKETRLNDNNKDVIHVETYSYGDNGKVRERSVYFPEFKVTKKFDEPAGNLPAKCFGIMPMGTLEKVNPKNRTAYITRVIMKNKALITDPSCKDYEFTFTNNTNCAITIATTKVNNGKTVKYRFKERL